MNVAACVTCRNDSGEMVFFHHPDEFCPVSESAYCGAGSVHTMLLHTTADGVLQFFPGVPSEVSIDIRPSRYNDDCCAVAVVFELDDAEHQAHSLGLC